MIQPKLTTLYTESNPNPNSLKFVANYNLVNPDKSYDFPNLESCQNAPLPKILFQTFPYVKRVFIMNNFITLTKNEESEWEEIKDEIKEFIKNYLSQDQSIILENEALEDTHEENFDDVELKIKNILDEYIKPAVEMDGGAITFHSFEDGRVTVTLQGACSGCPSSTITLKQGIESLLKKMVPEVQEVEALPM